MRRKILALTATTMLAMALAPHTIRAVDGLEHRHQVQIARVLARVQLAFETRESCRDLFSKYDIDASHALARAHFIYVGDALDSLGFAAATKVGTNRTFIGAAFYRNTSDIDGMATVLIHELLHQQGAGHEIDDYSENYEQISKACGTRNAAK